MRTHIRLTLVFIQSREGLRTESQVLMTDVAHQDTGYAGFVDVRLRQSDSLRHSLSVTHIDLDFDLSRTGFASRGDRTSMQYSLSRVQYQTARFQQVTQAVSVSGSWNSAGERTDSRFALGTALRDLGQNSWSISVSYAPSYVDDATAYRSLTFHTKPSAGIGLALTTNSTNKFYQSAWLGIQENRIQGKSNSLGFQFVYRPSESLTFNWRLSKAVNDGQVLYQGNRDFIRYRSWSPTSNIAVQVFLSTRHQIRLDFQCRMIQAKAYEYLTVEEFARQMSSVGFEINGESDDFSISRATFQLRYRWNIAPLSNLFIVYTRTGSIDSTIQNSVIQTLRETIKQRNTENIAIKFRWRTPLDY